MRIQSGLRPISLSVQTVLFVGLMVLLVLPTVLGFVFMNQIYVFYLSKFVAPELESDLGFKGGTTIVQGSQARYEAYALIDVDPSGVLGRAGVRAGEIPCRYAHGIEPGFLSHLHHARGREVDLVFCTPPEWSERRVRIAVPKSFD